MKKYLQSSSLSTGLAMFSMFFGAGNIIFPIAIGHFAGDKNLFAILGLIGTAALMPIAGVLAMVLFEGNYKAFFGRLGKSPGFFLSLIIISLLGPLGSTPRCIALSYATFHTALHPISPALFSALACLLIFVLSVKRGYILTLLGKILTPLLLLSLLFILVIGFITAPEMTHNDASNLSIFFYGVKEGYNTMDLLAAFFFSSMILNFLRLQVPDKEKSLKTTLRASLIGGALLAIVYTGFSYLAAFHSAHLDFETKDQLLTAIVLKLAGPSAGLLVCSAIALTCLTTAIALISAFADFFQKEVLREKVSYEKVLLGSLLVTFFVSTFQFTGISAFLGPILQICYPGLIVLTILNIAYRLKNFKPIKVPVFCAFALAALVYLIK